jgi:hypothetical protein
MLNYYSQFVHAKGGQSAYGSKAVVAQRQQF